MQHALLQAMRVRHVAEAGQRSGLSTLSFLPSLLSFFLSRSLRLLTSLLVCPASSTSSSLCDGALATASPSPPARPARRSVIELNIDMARADRASTLRWCVPTAAASTLAEVPLRPSAKMLETNSVQSCKFVPGCKVPSLLAQVDEEAGTLWIAQAGE
jgi:hypothetical protein